MTYLVSNQSRLFNSDKYEKISPEDALELLSKETLLGADTETEGMSPYTKKLLTVQLGTEDFQIVWDCTTIDVQMLKPILENPNIKTVWWNAKFDLQFLYHQRIIPVNIYDGMLAEKLMWLGYPPGMHSMSLKAAGETYCGVELDKTVRGQIINKGLSPEVVEYAANDVKYEIPIYKAQQEELKKKDLLKAIQFENEFVKVLAYIEYCGVKLDVNKWKKKMEFDLERSAKAEKALNDWVVQFYNEHFYKDGFIMLDDEIIPFDYVYTDPQGNLFTGFDLEPKCKLNWSSSKQLIPLFTLLGFNLETFDKATKTKRLSVESKIIGSQEDVSSIASLYVEYKKAEKITTTYGQNFLDAINKISGRIHPTFYQLMDTGRLSCGGGDSGINIQNIPHDAETRACFVAESGNDFISADYQSQESRLIASVSGDQNMIDIFTKGCEDVHSLVAYMSYPHIIPRDTRIEDISKLYKSARQDAKRIEFAINYGGDFNTIANNQGIPLKEAKEIYANFMKGFPGVAKYQEYCRRAVIETGYILLNPVTKHKAYIYDYDEVIKPILSKLDDKEFWDYYYQMKKESPNCDTVRAIAKYKNRRAASEKQSINYRIQNRGAMCFKLASILLFNYLKEHNLLFTVKYCIPVHDEINLECPKELSDEISKVLVKCMEKGAKPFCTKLHLGVDVSVGDHWIH